MLWLTVIGTVHSVGIAGLCSSAYHEQTCSKEIPGNTDITVQLFGSLKIKPYNYVIMIRNFQNKKENMISYS